MFELDEDTLQALKQAARHRNAALGDLVRIALNNELVGRQAETNLVTDQE